MDHSESLDNLKKHVTNSENQEIIAYSNSERLKSMVTIKNKISEHKKDIKSIEEVNKQGYIHLKI
jgi:predicted phage-related endonuclease